MLKRKQIQLTERQAAALRREAARRGISDAAVVRDLVERWIGERTQEDLGSRYGRALRVVGRFRSGKTNIAREHDRYLGENGRW